MRVTAFLLSVVCVVLMAGQVVAVELDDRRMQLGPVGNGGAVTGQPGYTPRAQGGGGAAPTPQRDAGGLVSTIVKVGTAVKLAWDLGKAAYTSATATAPEPKYYPPGAWCEWR